MAETNNNKPSTQQYLDIAEIHDGVVILKDGSLRAVLMVSSVNFALKADKEKDAIIYSFQNFLNYLNFDVQVLVRSRRLDLKDYLQKMNGIAQKQKNAYIKAQTEEYIGFVQSLLDVVNIMDKQFFVVVPFYPNVVQNTKGIGSKIKGMIAPSDNSQVDLSNFEENRVQLMQRVDVVASHLSAMELRCASLDTQELIELFYMSYNPDSSKNQKLTSIDELTNNIIHGGQPQKAPETATLEI